MKSLAIITARSGSKRIPDKNIRDFAGAPMISYPIKAALESGIFDEVMVSTESVAYADIAMSHGAKVPFLRSAQTSTDTATTAEVIEEVLKEYGKMGRTFTHVCCIYPTAALVDLEVLRKSYEQFRTAKVHSLIPIVEYSHPIQRAITIKEDGGIKFVDERHSKTRTQDLQKTYHDCGMFYWLDVARFSLRPDIITEGSAGFVMDPLRVQDIDNLNDWRLAELKFQLLRQLKP